ncbi:type IV pilus modification PilV family protein [Planctomicrobium sp. SH661]|uniref:type IV pilus modification PilV family protein n=1 Tax=Planctomicrobium sp. SH661 TaxID=3448124 RepID=UPI003F5C20F8
MRWHSRNSAVTPPARSGATLVEVLMSLLIMSIGIVTVFTLFPVSLLSSIKSNQLTTARLYADQIAATIRMRPELVIGGSVNAGSDPFWTSGETIVRGDVISRSIPAGSLSPSNRSYFVATADGKCGVIEPDWSTAGQTINEGAGGPTWRRSVLPTSGNTNSFVPYRYVVDPYGAMTATANPSIFGNNDGGLPPEPYVLRINGGANNELKAFNSRFALPDTWVVATTAIPLSATTVDTDSDSVADATDLTFSSTTDLSAFPKWVPGDPNPPVARVVAVSPDGRRSQAAYILQNSGNTLRVNSLVLTNNTTPGPISAGTIGPVRLETFDRRYTWMGTVERQPDGVSQVQIAVFFNRGFRPADEQVYQYVRQSADTADITVPSGTPAPFISEGGYVFDVATVKFHRILSVSGSTTKRIVVSPSLDTTLPNNRTYMIFLPGIVRVYDLTL